MTLRAENASPVSISYSPDGSSLACGYRDGSVRVWEARSGDLWARWRTPPRVPPMVRVLFAPDGRHVVTTSGENGIDVWHTSGRHVRELYSHAGTGQRRSCAFTTAGKLLISWHRGSSGGATELPAFDPRDWTPVESGYRVPVQISVPGLFAVEPGGSRIVTEYGDVFGPAPDSRTYNLIHCWRDVHALAWCPGRNVVAFLKHSAGLVVADADRGGEVARVPDGKLRTNAVSFTPGGGAMLAGGTRGVVRLIDTATWAETGGMDLAAGAVHELAVGPDGLTAAAICGRRQSDRGVVVWDLQ